MPANFSITLDGAGTPVGSGNPLPVSAASLPLPSGAATSAGQSSQLATLGATTDAEATSDGSIVALLKRLRTLLGGTLAVSAASLPLPSGAATAAGQASQLATLGATTDAEATSDGSIVALLKRLRTLLAGTLTVRVSGGTTTTVTVVTLPAATATQLAAANSSRRTLSLCNTGTGPASVGFGNTVTASTGWPLAAAPTSGEQGGGYEFPPQAVHTGAVWAFSTSGTTIAVLEG